LQIVVGVQEFLLLSELDPRVYIVTGVCMIAVSLADIRRTDDLPVLDGWIDPMRHKRWPKAQYHLTGVENQFFGYPLDRSYIPTPWRELWLRYVIGR
jgi:hypothetical protein